MPPAAPADAKAADVADPGSVDVAKAAQQASGTGKYGASPVKPYKPDPAGASDPDKPTSWIEVQLVDEAGAPVSGRAYRITLADGTVDDGTLGADGVARLDGIEPGSCNITFPDLDQDAWTSA